MRRWGMGIAAGLLFALVGALGAPAASGVVGQAAEPTIVVEQAQPLLAAYDYTVRVVGADGAPISGAAVTGTPVGPDGYVGRITTLNALDQEGRYRGIVEMPAPGTWTVRFAVADPVANLEHVQEMTVPGGATPTETPAPAPTEAPAVEEPPPADAGSSAGNPDVTEQPAGDDPAAAPEDVAPEDEDESSAVSTVLAIAAAVLILAFGTAVVIARRRREAALANDPNTKEDPLHALDLDDNSDNGEAKDDEAESADEPDTVATDDDAEDDDAKDDDAETEPDPAEARS